MTNNKGCRICGSNKLLEVLNAGDFKIVTCKACKITFTDPAPTLPDYVNMDFHSKEDTANINVIQRFTDLPFDWKEVINRQIEEVYKSVSYNGAILEIGCGEGIFLDQLSQRGFKNAVGIEPSLNAALRAQTRGLHVINKYFDETVVAKKFDLVIMSHIFEHIADPLAFLSSLSKVLNQNGQLMFVQTNYKGLIPFAQKRDWYAWVPEQHYWHFTPKSLAGILRKSGFETLGWQYCSLVHPHGKLYRITKVIKSLQDQFILMAKIKPENALS